MAWAWLFWTPPPIFFSLKPASLHWSACFQRLPCFFWTGGSHPSLTVYNLHRKSRCHKNQNTCTVTSNVHRNWYALYVYFWLPSFLQMAKLKRIYLLIQERSTHRTGIPIRWQVRVLAFIISALSTRTHTSIYSVMRSWNTQWSKKWQ